MNNNGHSNILSIKLQLEDSPEHLKFLYKPLHYAKNFCNLVDKNDSKYTKTARATNKLHGL